VAIHRWGLVFGVLAAVFLVAGVLISGNSPAGDAPDDEWVQYIDDDKSVVLVRAYLLIAAGLALVAFYAFGLEPLLGNADVTDRALARLGYGATLIAAGALTFAGLIGAAVGAADIFADIPPDPTIARLFDNLFYGGIVVGTALALGVLMAVVAIQTQRRGVFPAWVLWLSIVGVLAMAGSLFFLPFVLAPVWLIAVSIAAGRAPRAAVAGQAVAPV